MLPSQRGKRLMHYDLSDMLGVLGVIVVLLCGIAYLAGIPPIPFPLPLSGWGELAMVAGAPLMAPMTIRRVLLFFV